MQTEFERRLIAQAAPTLAGIKAGSLFPYAAEFGEKPEETVRFWNERLGDKGVLLSLVRDCPGGLVYVCRPAWLHRLLSDPEIAAFLHGFGYAGCDGVFSYVERLRVHFGCLDRFPHEIGIFLGYPLEDVRGFIEHKGKDFDLCGLWKVYGDRSRAERLFSQYKSCKNIYKSMFEQGSSILQLTVAV